MCSITSNSSTPAYFDGTRLLCVNVQKKRKGKKPGLLNLLFPQRRFYVISHVGADYSITTILTMELEVIGGTKNFGSIRRLMDSISRILLDRLLRLYIRVYH